jgi:hypothetical protein
MTFRCLDRCICLSIQHSVHIVSVTLHDLLCAIICELHEKGIQCAVLRRILTQDAGVNQVSLTPLFSDCTVTGRMELYSFSTPLVFMFLCTSFAPAPLFNDSDWEVTIRQQAGNSFLSYGTSKSQKLCMSHIYTFDLI